MSSESTGSLEIKMKVLQWNEYYIALDTEVSQEEAQELATKYGLVKDTWVCSNCDMENDCVGDFECEEDLYMGCFVISFKEFRQSVFSKNWYGECSYSRCKNCRA